MPDYQSRIPKGNAVRVPLKSPRLSIAQAFLPHFMPFIGKFYVHNSPLSVFGQDGTESGNGLCTGKEPSDRYKCIVHMHAYVYVVLTTLLG